MKPANHIKEFMHHNNISLHHQTALAFHKQVRVFNTSITKDNILIMFLIKNREFLDFSKSLFKTSKIQHIDYENISTVLCTTERGHITKIRQGSNQQKLQI